MSDAILIYLFSLAIGLTTSAFVNETVRQTQQKSEYLRTALKRQHRFLAQTAHEIRTPLMHASSIIELLAGADEDSFLTDHPAQRRELLPLLRRSTENVKVLVSNVLDLEQIASKTLQLEIIPFDVHSLLAESARSIMDLNKQRDHNTPAPVEMGVVIDPSVPRVVSGDQMRIRQILFNILDNACKFGPNVPGHVQVVTICVRVSRQPNSKKANLVFEVADNGIGMDSDKLSVIFTGFHFMENLYTTGMQLGLAAAQSLARHMGGDIRAASEGRGCGSRFTCTLEVDVYDDESKETSPSPKVPGAVYFVPSCASIGSVLRPVLERIFSTVHIHDDLQLMNKKTRVALVIADATSESIVDMERTVSEIYRCPFLAVVDASILRACSNIVADSVITSVIAKPIISHLFIEAIDNSLASFGSRRTRSFTEEDSIQVIRTVSESDDMPSKRSSLSILLVDDIPTNLKVVGRTLQSLGHVVITAENGLEALSLIERKQSASAGLSLPGNLNSSKLTDQAALPFDVVITDVMMPVMDGVTLIKTVRELESNGGHFRLPMIALTAAATAQVTDECLKAGADRILSKPFTKEVLKDALDIVSNRRFTLVR